MSTIAKKNSYTLSPHYVRLNPDVSQRQYEALICYEEIDLSFSSIIQIERNIILLLHKHQ